MTHWLKANFPTTRAAWKRLKAAWFDYRAAIAQSKDETHE